MRFYCTSTGPIGGHNCEVLLIIKGQIGTNIDNVNQIE